MKRNLMTCILILKVKIPLLFSKQEKSAGVEIDEENSLSVSSFEALPDWTKHDAYMPISNTACGK